MIGMFLGQLFINDIERVKYKSTLLHFRAEELIYAYIRIKTKCMKKLIYRNIISIIVFFILPWFAYEKFYQPGMKDLYVNLLIYFMLAGAIYLVCTNIHSSIKTKKTSRIVSIAFVIPPALILLYFILGYFAFSGFTGF